MRLFLEGVCATTPTRDFGTAIVALPVTICEHVSYQLAGLYGLYQGSGRRHRHLLDFNGSDHG